MIVTFGLLAAFFVLVVLVLQRNRIHDHSFEDYAVGGRSFGAGYQAMSFLNTWYPGAMFTAFAGLAAGSGVIAFYVLVYSLLTVVLMYVMAQSVWIWGRRFGLHTQPDLFALRYGSRHLRTVAAVVGIVSGVPWLVLGMQALGVLFSHLSLGALTFPQAVVLGVAVIALRQVWTVRMGMRGVVISDMVQGWIAYVFGGAVLCGLIAWLSIERGASLATLDPRLFALPGPGSKEGPLYLFSLLLTGTLGGWCWPYIFVRLFTADSVATLKKSAAIAMPLSFGFGAALLLFGLFASVLPAVAAKPEDVWFIVSEEAGGLVVLGLAGVIVLAASMGHTDGNIQATGAQLANDLIGNYLRLDDRQLIVVAKVGMIFLTALSAWLACLELPALFTLAVLAYQGIIQLAVPQFLGIFWKRGNRVGALAGLVSGFALVVALELFFREALAHAQGVSSGLIGLALNVVVYVACAYAFPSSVKERHRIERLFAMIDDADEETVAPPAAASVHVGGLS